jgi:molybdopterin molybdotransferase
MARSLQAFRDGGRENVRFLSTVSPDELRRFASSITPLGREVVPLSAGLGRVTAVEIRAEEDLPRFRRSVMDGYAVRGLETTGASSSSPAYLACVGEILIGREPGLDIPPGGCCRIPTGGMLPPSADAVVMVEYTRELPGGLVEVTGSVAPGENLAEIGEDVAQGTRVVAEGVILRPAEVGILAGLGRTRIEVFRRPRVAILSTGDELVDPAMSPGPGQVRNVNQYSLMAHVLAAGGEPVLLGVAPDEREEIEARVRRGLGEADLVLISGGSSVGSRDLTAAIIDSLGPPGIIFHGVATRPGKPTIVGRSGEKVIFGLPGHPVSAMVSFINFVRPALLALQGVASPPDHPVRATLEDNIPSKPGREDYVQVTLREEIPGSMVAVPLFKKSGMVTSMVGADGFIVIPAETEGLEAGDEVTVHLYQRVLR